MSPIENGLYTENFTGSDEASRHKGVRRFLTKKSQKQPPTKRDFTAYGQACIHMACRVFELLEEHDACLFASAIPCGTKPPKDYAYSDFLRKDHVFLQERFFWFLEAEMEHGLFVLDQTETQHDRRFIDNLHRYYTKTDNGRKRTQWIVPAPLFVDSALTPGIQAADLCIYCINWGFRQYWWKVGPPREEIRKEFAGRCGKLQFSGDSYEDGKTHKLHGIVYVSDPYTSSKKGRA